MELYPEMRKPGFRDKLMEIGPKAQKAGLAVLKRLPMAGAFFLLSLAQCFYVPSPYAVCCLAAILRQQLSPAGAGIGLAAGMAFRLVWGLPLDIWQALACLICLLLMRLPIRKNGQVTALTGALLLFRALPGMMGASEAQGIILNAASILLGVASMPALLRAAGIWKSGFRELSADDMLCLLLPCLLVIAGAGRISLFQVNLGYLCAGVFTLTAAWIMGTGSGVMCGLGGGMALLLSGQSALLMVNLVFGALLSGLTRGKKRMMAAAFYLLAAVTATYLIVLSFQPALFLSDGAAAVLFCLIPGKGMNALNRLYYRAQWQKPKENAYTRLQMQRWVRAIDRMADALPKARVQEKTEEEMSEEIAESLCADCERMADCWQDRYAETKEGMAALVRGEEDELDVINRYFTACPRISRLPALVQRLDGERKKRDNRALCADYEREMLQTHLTALSQAAQRISLDGAVSEEEAYWVSLAEEALQAHRFPGKAVFVKRVEGRMSVCLQSEMLVLGAGIDGALVRDLCLRFHAPLKVTQNQGGRILLEEEPPLRVETGTATACAVTPERKRQAGLPLDNGDAVLTGLLTSGRVLIALSDGMGHGAGAQEESGKTLELLQMCLEAGYTLPQAMTAVNGSMLSATGGEKFATVDLCLIDLWTGEGTMNKLGACASYLIRGQKIEVIEGEALPLGIVERIAPMEHTFKTGEEDMLLLVTDGVTDAFSSDDAILSILRRDRGGTPQQIADNLLREALIQYNGMPEDDMTVVCAKVLGRKAKK